MKIGVLMNIETPKYITLSKGSENRKKGTFAEDMSTMEKRLAQNKKQGCSFSFLLTMTLTVELVGAFLSVGERLSGWEGRFS